MKTERELIKITFRGYHDWTTEEREAIYDWLRSYAQQVLDDQTTDKMKYANTWTARYLTTKV